MALPLRGHGESHASHHIFDLDAAGLSPKELHHSLILELGQLVDRLLIDGDCLPGDIRSIRGKISAGSVCLVESTGWLGDWQFGCADGTWARPVVLIAHRHGHVANGLAVHLLSVALFVLVGLRRGLRVRLLRERVSALVELCRRV